MVVVYLSRSLLRYEKYGSMTPNCLFFMQRVLGLRACLILPGFFNELEYDVEETSLRVLASDRSSARLLNHLISPFAVVHGLHSAPSRYPRSWRSAYMPK